MGILDRFKKERGILGQNREQPAPPTPPTQPTSPPPEREPTRPTNGGSVPPVTERAGSAKPSPLRNTNLGSNRTTNSVLSQTTQNSYVSPKLSVQRQDSVVGLRKKIESEDAPIRISIMNGKGGSGKSTIATNLATVLSTHANSVTIIDNDPQASSMRWLKERPHNSVPIRGVYASEMTRLKNIQLWNSGVGAETKYVVIDTQAGLKGMELSDVIDRSDMIIIPVLPSAIDMRATADFVAQVFLSKSYRRSRKPIGVVANRVINDSVIYRKLQKFLLSLRMHFISTFNDNKAYLVAAEKGEGIFEINESEIDKEQVEWDLLKNWVEDKQKSIENRAVR